MNNRPDFPRITNEWMLFILHIFSFLKEGWGDMCCHRDHRYPCASKCLHARCDWWGSSVVGCAVIQNNNLMEICDVL